MTSEQEEMHRMLTVRVNALSDDVDRFRAELCKVADRAEQADRRLADEMADALVKVHDKLDQTIAQQAARHADQAIQMSRLQSSIDKLDMDLKEPMEAWKTAKYGSKAAAFLASIARAIGPILIAAIVGIGALQTKMLVDIKTEIKPDVKTTNGAASAGGE